MLSLQVSIILDSRISSSLLVKIKSGIETPFIVFVFNLRNVVSVRQHSFLMFFIGKKGFPVIVHVVEFPVSCLKSHLCDLCNTKSALCMCLLKMCILSFSPDPQYQKVWRWVSAVCFNKPFRSFSCLLKYEKHYCKASPISSDCEAM